MSLKVSKKAIHKTLINHHTNTEPFVQETISFDAGVSYNTDNIVTHLQVTAEVNSRKNGIIPESKYEIFFCSYGQFKTPKDYSVTDLKSKGLYEIINILLPPAKKEYDRILKSRGMGTPKDSEEPFPELTESVDKESVAALLNSGTIRIRLSN